MNTIKVTYDSEIPENFTGIVEYPSGGRHWYKERKYHRLDGPAVEYSDGMKIWCLENQYYLQINLNNYVVLDSYQGKHGIMWYKILTKDEIVEYPDIPGLITK